jgi:rhodanese-related sulfurtransferase
MQQYRKITITKRSITKEKIMKLKTITREQLKARIDNGSPTILVEALPARYYDQAHLPGAINIPHDDIRAVALTRLPDKAATIVVYCASTPCQNSRQALITLTQMGYEDAYEYVEGKADWEEAGYPLESSVGTTA